MTFTIITKVGITGARSVASIGGHVAILSARFITGIGITATFPCAISRSAAGGAAGAVGTTSPADPSGTTAAGGAAGGGGMHAGVGTITIIISYLDGTTAGTGVGATAAGAGIGITSGL